jgi:hypothetical protein
MVHENDIPHGLLPNDVLPFLGGVLHRQRKQQFDLPSFEIHHMRLRYLLMVGDEYVRKLSLPKSPSGCRDCFLAMRPHRLT